MIKLLPKLPLSTIKIPPVDLKRYLNKEQGWQEDCKVISESLHRYGVCVAKDPRCKFQQKERFLDVLEKYFVDRSERRDKGEPPMDLGAEGSYVGLIYEGKQQFSTYNEKKATFLPPNHSMTPDEAIPDPTWRYRWLVDSKKNVIPSEFENWAEIMESWGHNKMECCKTIAEMTALGFGIEKDFFLNSILKGTKHLTPTASDLTKLKLGQVISAFHYDFDFLTVHGKPRFSGLLIWLNTGEKVEVQVPEGHLLLQAGKQFEWLTGGHVKAGWHQVVFTQQVQQQRDEAIKKGKTPWRISSILFYQMEGSYMMKPHPKFTDETTSKLYPQKNAHEYLSSQLQLLSGYKFE